MNFKKKFDYNDINNFLFDNVTLCNADYFENKFHNKLPDGYAQILEAESRVEYSEEDVKMIIENVKNTEKAWSEQLMKEYEERALDGLMHLEINPKIDENIIIVDDKNISNNNIDE